LIIEFEFKLKEIKASERCKTAKKPFKTVNMKLENVFALLFQQICQREDLILSVNGE
jgi:hypothetical protein